MTRWPGAVKARVPPRTQHDVSRSSKKYSLWSVYTNSLSGRSTGTPPRRRARAGTPRRHPNAAAALGTPRCRGPNIAVEGLLGVVRNQLAHSTKIRGDGATD